MASQFEREKNGLRFALKGGMNTVRPSDLLSVGQYPYLQNVRRLFDGQITSRPPLGENQLAGALPAGITSLTRMNDTTADGPAAGYVLISGAAGSMYVNATSVKSGLSGKPLSFLPFRPSQSPQPWCYVGDANAMWKVRSDGTTWKVGIAEPQAAPGVAVSTGTGPNWVSYRYTYRSSITGATSNPSPESAPQTVPQDSAAGSLAATSTNITFNASQYQVSGSQLRTTGGVAPGTVTDYVIAHNFGLSIPTTVNIDGVLAAMNWLGQFAGTGIITAVALFYQGQIIGQIKAPGLQNSQSSTTATQGGNSDSWGTVLTPAIVNDSTFGIGFQITAQESSGSDRSFLNNFTVTVYYTTLAATVTGTPSSDPQVDSIDFYRMDPGLPNFTYVGTVPNGTAGFSDTQSDLVVAQNPILSFENYEPFPSIDLPRAGTVNVGANGAVTWVSGDHFNVRWLPGNIIVIAGVAYTLYNRPTSTTALIAVTTTTSTNGYVTTGYPPTGTGLSYAIKVPELAAQPSPAIWGPTPDNAGSFYFGLDPNNPGDLLWSLGNNFDSAPDTNRLYVTSPSEPLMNGVVTSELSAVFSTDRFWLIYPNFADAVAAVTGTLGQQWTLVQSSATRGLYMRYAIAALGAMIAWRAKDSICISMGGGPEQSITEDIYNLFPHGGQAPQPVVVGGYTVYPPDDTKAAAQTISIVPGYIFYDYQDTTGTQRTLIYDVEAKGWSVDTYIPAVNCHAWATGPVNEILAGCADGTARLLASGAPGASTSVVLTPANNNGDARALKQLGDVFIKALVAASNPVSVALYQSRYGQALAGFAPLSLIGTGSFAPYIIDFTAGTGQQVTDIGVALSWPTGSENILDLWQPDFVPQPEATQDRPTDWDDLGYPGTKFVQGLMIEADTFGAAKALRVQRSDDSAFFTPNESPITLNGQTYKALTFTPPFTASNVRIAPDDGVPWRMWGAKWVFQPYPENVAEYQTEFTSHGMQGWFHLYEMNLSYASGAALAVTLEFDAGPSISLSFPSSAGAQVKNVTKIPANKCKLVSYRVASAAPFRLFRAQAEVKVKQWGVASAYRVVNPFGGASGEEANL